MAAVAPGTLELLTWLNGGRRTYAEAMETWGSWCPRHAAWEDALAERLIRVRRGEVALTAAGRDALEAAAAQPTV